MGQSSVEWTGSDATAQAGYYPKSIDNVTLVLLPLKYEIDDSVTEGGGAPPILDIQVRRLSTVDWTHKRCGDTQKLTSKIQVCGISAHLLYTQINIIERRALIIWEDEAKWYIIYPDCSYTAMSDAWPSFRSAYVGVLNAFCSSNTIVNSTPRTSNTNVTQSIH